MQAILALIVKFILESLFGLIKETLLSPVKVTTSGVKTNIPPVYDRIAAARLVDNFNKLPDDKRT